MELREFDSSVIGMTADYGLGIHSLYLNLGKNLPVFL